MLRSSFLFRKLFTKHKLSCINFQRESRNVRSRVSIVGKIEEEYFHRTLNDRFRILRLNRRSDESVKINYKLFEWMIQRSGNEP